MGNRSRGVGPSPGPGFTPVAISTAIAKAGQSGRRGERRLSAAHTGPVNVEANPDQVHGCAKCLELVEEDLQDDNDYRGHRQEAEVDIIQMIEAR